MEPRIASPNPSSEMGPYRAPEALQSPQNEEAVRPGQERLANQEAAASSSAQPPQVATVKALPQLPSLPSPQLAVGVSTVKTSSPLVAADEDLIEKEWVDRAKKIVLQTKDDPYNQEKEVSKLQADYLKKRYGKEIKVSSD